MRATWATLHLVWWMHEFSPVLGSLNGIIEHPNGASGHVFGTSDDDDDPPDDGQPDKEGSIGQVTSSLLSKVYNVAIPAKIFGGDGAPVVAGLCLPDGCRYSQPARGLTEFEAEILAWLRLAYELKSIPLPAVGEEPPSSRSLTAVDADAHFASSLSAGSTFDTLTTTFSSVNDSTSMTAPTMSPSLAEPFSRSVNDDEYDFKSRTCKTKYDFAKRRCLKIVSGSTGGATLVSVIIGIFVRYARQDPSLREQLDKLIADRATLTEIEPLVRPYLSEDAPPEQLTWLKLALKSKDIPTLYKPGQKLDPVPPKDPNDPEDPPKEPEVPQPPPPEEPEETYPEPDDESLELRRTRCEFERDFPFGAQVKDLRFDSPTPSWESAWRAASYSIWEQMRGLGINQGAYDAKAAQKLYKIWRKTHRRRRRVSVPPSDLFKAMQEYISHFGGPEAMRIGVVTRDQKMGLIPDAITPPSRPWNPEDRLVWLYHNGMSGKDTRWFGLDSLPPRDNKYEPLYPRYGDCPPRPELEQEKKQRCEFEKTYPGGVELLETPGEDLLCGWRAMQGALRYQFPGVRLPIFEELRLVWTQVKKEHNDNLAPGFPIWDNDNMFTVEQLYETLKYYLKEQDPDGKPLNLGILGPAFKNDLKVLSNWHEERSGAPTLWVHHDNVDDRPGKGTPHYQALKAADLPRDGPPPDLTPPGLDKCPAGGDDPGTTTTSSTTGTPGPAPTTTVTETTTEQIPGPTQPPAPLPTSVCRYKGNWGPWRVYINKWGHNDGTDLCNKVHHFMGKTGAKFRKGRSPRCRWAGPHENGVIMNFDFVQVFPITNAWFRKNVQKAIFKASPGENYSLKCLKAR